MRRLGCVGARLLSSLQRAMVQYTERSFVNGRKQRIVTVCCKPDAAAVDGVLFFCHGFGEYAGRLKHGQFARSAILSLGPECGA